MSGSKSLTLETRLVLSRILRSAHVARAELLKEMSVQKTTEFTAVVPCSISAKQTLE